MLTHTCTHSLTLMHVYNYMYLHTCFIHMAKYINSCTYANIYAYNYSTHMYIRMLICMYLVNIVSSKILSNKYIHRCINACFPANSIIKDQRASKMKYHFFLHTTCGLYRKGDFRNCERAEQSTLCLTVSIPVIFSVQVVLLWIRGCDSKPPPLANGDFPASDTASNEPFVSLKFKGILDCLQRTALESLRFYGYGNHWYRIFSVNRLVLYLEYPLLPLEFFFKRCLLEQTNVARSSQMAVW